MPDVLLVEDEPDIAELIEEALVDAGLSVAVAHSDTAAYAKLDHEARSFAALVTDINLGSGVSGFDIARHARELNPHLKVVYITGQAAHLARLGLDDALMFPKPFDPRELADQVTMLLGLPKGPA